SKDGGTSNFNEIRFEDKKGSEQIFIQAEKNLDIVVESDRTENVGGHRYLTVQGEAREKVVKDKNLHVQGELLTWVEKDTHHIVGGDLVEEFQKNHAQVVSQELYMTADRIIVEGHTEICLKVGGNFVSVSSAGVMIEGIMVNINCGNTPSPSDPASGLQ